MGIGRAREATVARAVLRVFGVSVALISFILLATPALAINGVRICGINYDCGINDGVCPSDYAPAGPGNACAVCDADCGTFCGVQESTPVLCSNGPNDDAPTDAVADWADIYNLTGGYDIRAGQSCNVFNESYCTAPVVGGVPVKIVGSVSQPAAAALPSIAYAWRNATQDRPGTGAVLRLDPDGTVTPTSAWCTVCATGYAWNGGLGACVAAENSLAVGTVACQDSYDNDQDATTDYNDVDCNTCSLAAVQTRVPGAPGFSTATTGTAGTVYTNVANGPGYPAPQTLDASGRRISSAVGAAPGACYAITCQAGYSYNASTNACSPSTCLAIGSPCVANDDCGLYGPPTSCGLLCVAGRCTAPPTPVLTITPAAGPYYTGDSIRFDLSSTNPGITTQHRLDWNGVPGYDASAAGAVSVTNGYGTRGSKTITGTIDWSGGNPAVFGNASTVSSIFIFQMPFVQQFTTTPITTGQAPVANTSYLLLLNGSVDPALVASASYEIDTNENNATYEYTQASIPATGTTTPAANSLVALGAHRFYARITDGVRTVNASTVFTVTPNTPPVISWYIVNTTQVWGGAQATFNFSVSDNTAAIDVNLSFGDGTYYSFNTGAATGASQIVNKFYAQNAVPANAILNVTDSGSPALTTSSAAAVNRQGLPCVSGTEAGNATYNDNAAQCCNSGTEGWSCPRDNATGWSYCYAVPSCVAAPPTEEICGAVPITPPTWDDRDTNRGACEALTATCAQLNWTNATGSGGTPLSCCGDDPNEQTAGWTYDPTNGPGAAACCLTSGATACYTSAFAPGGSPGCFAGLENTAALCADHNDNDCDGLVDAADPNCGSTVGGTVWLLDQYGSISTQAGVQVIASGNFRTTTAVDGSYSLMLAAGTYTIYATQFGFAVNQTTLVVVPASTISLNFTLPPRRCNADCTNDQGLCDASCLGVGLCQPQGGAAQVLAACHPSGAVYGLPPGTLVELQYNPATQQKLVGTCCAGTPVWVDAPPATVEENATTTQIPTLVKLTRYVTLNGKTYQFVVSVW